MSTKKIVPRADGEGGLGSTVKQWGSLDAKTLHLTGGATVTTLSTDGTLAGNVDTIIPTQKAVKKYVDDSVGAENLWDRTGTNLLPHTTGDSIGVTGTRIFKGWFTDLEVTNAIAGSITGIAAKATNLVGGNSTTLKGSIPYQSNTDTTTLLSPNVTVTQKFLSMTGDGTNGAVPTWETVSQVWLKTLTVLSPATANDSVSIPINALGATYSAGLSLSNNTAAIVGTVAQYAPTLNFLSHVLNTTGNTDETSEWRLGARVTSGTTPSGTFYLRYSANGGAYTEPFSVSNGGFLSITGSMELANDGNISNRTTANYGKLNFGTVTSSGYYSRNTADAYPALITNLVHASSTANIHCFHWQSILRACVTKEGNWLSYANSDDTTSRSLAFYKSRGTNAVPLTVVTGDYLGEVVGYGYGGASGYVRSASIRFKSSGTIADTRVPSSIEFWTGTDALPSVETLRVIINQAGNCTFYGTGTFYGAILAIAGEVTSRKTALTTTSTDGLIAENTTAALVGTPVQMPPRTRYSGQAWETTGGTSQNVSCISELLPVSGATASGTYRIGFSINGGAYTYPLQLTSLGALTTTLSINSGAHLTLPSNYEIFNSASVTIFSIKVGSATTSAVWSRNTADAYTTAVINNLNAGSTGKILSCQWQSVERLNVTREGNISAPHTDGIKIGITTSEKLGFWNATPVVQPVTNAYTSDPESGAYSGINNAQVGSVYAQLSDLNILRVAYDNLRSSYDDLLAKLKTTGIVA